MRTLRRNVALGVAAFCVVLGGTEAYWNAPSVDESAHLPAGLSHWQLGRFDAYAVNPPLIRMLAALPFVVLPVKSDWSRLRSDPSSRSEFKAAEDFGNKNGRSTFLFYTIARWACIPFNLLGAIVCFHWGKELYGENAGLLAAALWCFSPNILANAAMIIPDCGAAALGMLACYSFWRWLREPTWRRGLFAGIGLGLAELTKFTWIILYPLFVMLWLLYRWKSSSVAGWKKETGQLAVMFLLAVYLINTGYGYEGSFTKLKEFGFVSKALGGPEEGRSAQKGNRFRESFLGELPVPVPRNYLLGIDVQKRDFERGIRSYLHGEWKHGGWWYYYLYALLVKVPVGTWILFLLAVFVTIRYGSRWVLPPERAGTQRRLGITWRDELVLLAPAVVVLVLVSSQTGFNHHLRYVLPAFPFGFIFISKVAGFVRWPGKTPVAHAPGSPGIRNPQSEIRNQKAPSLARRACVPGRWFSVVAAGALVWSVGSSLWVYPHSMSYFNELAGGPMNGHKHLVNSNIDWGQDLLFLKDWYDAHPEARPFHLAYFGGFDPHVAGFQYELPPNDPRPGWHAVSVNLMRGLHFGVWNAQRQREWAGEGRYTYFQHFKPTARAGYSIYIYHITYEDAQRVRKELGLPPLPPRK